MITQQCERCKKKETYATGGKPQDFVSPLEQYCKTCNAGWGAIAATLLDNYNNTVSTRRDKYFRLGDAE